jgi:hypothetical protein
MRRLVAPLGALIALAAVVMSGVAATAAAPTFLVVKLPNTAVRTEPRVAIDPDSNRFLITNQVRKQTTDPRLAIVFKSSDGGVTWSRTTDPTGSVLASTDVDIVPTRTGRLVAVELDYAPAVTNRVVYSDDHGQSWHEALHPALADDDRPWLAVGPDDPNTHQPRVYLLWHNLGSGSVTHNMFVATSVDGGTSFGAPTPITQPAGPTSDAWNDLQCADSGGPSNIFVSPTNGRVYAVWGTRKSGCTVSISPGPFEINVVAATRVWVATSADPLAGGWTTSLAVDDSTPNKIVSYQLSPGALDTAGNVYVAYAESQNEYPNYDGSSLKYVWSHADLAKWSAPVTVEAGGDPSTVPGNVLPHIVAGEPGNLDIAYQHGILPPNPRKACGPDSKAACPLWYTKVAQVTGALGGSPSISTTTVSNVPAFNDTASVLMGACTSGPEPGITNNVCGRATDVWAIALDRNCRLTIAWSSEATNPANAPGADPGTWVATQNGGSPLGGPNACANLAGNAVSAPIPALPATGRPPSTPWLPTLVFAAAGIAAGARMVKRRRSRRAR